jgi:hypothetical protein
MLDYGDSLRIALNLAGQLRHGHVGKKGLPADRRFEFGLVAGRRTVAWCNPAIELRARIRLERALTGRSRSFSR